MATTRTSRHYHSQQPQTWDHLKVAIAATSGFQRWQIERSSTDVPSEDRTLDRQVKLYLRETLETLAY